MLYENVNIDALACELPPERVTSSDIERELRGVYEKLNLPEGRLELMSGVRERRLWPRGAKPSGGAVLAGKKALAGSSVPKRKIGALFMCSVCRDFLEPATATVVHAALGLRRECLVYDISNACLGVLSGMLAAANMIELGQTDAALVVAGENSRPLLETTLRTLKEDMTLTRRSIKPYFASLTIGSGAVAVLLANPGTASGNHRLVAASSLSDTRYNDLCLGNSDKGMSDNTDTMMRTDSEMLMKRGIEVASDTWKLFLEEAAWTNDTPDCFCTHQVGSAHSRLLFESLGIDREKDFQTLEFLGNTGSTSCPTTFAMAVEKSRIAEGDKVALLGIGSGINCTMMGVEW